MLTLVALVGGLSLNTHSLADEAPGETASANTAATAEAVERRRQQWLTSLRSALAARGVPEQTGPAASRHDGGSSVLVGADRMSVTVAYVDKDGELKTACVEGAEEAARVLAAAEQDAR